MTRHWIIDTVGALGLALAMPFTAHGQPPAVPNAAPSFHDAVAAAWARLPQRQDFAARQGVAAARFATGGALFPNAPYATGTYVNDKILGSNQSYITSQGELGTPVWLPGEGTATQGAATADAAAVDAQAAAAHLGIAVQVLDLAARAALAVNDRDVAQRRLAVAQGLAADLARRFRVGESPESDSLTASAEAASASMALAAAEARVGTAVSAFSAITGLDAPPRLATPPRFAARRSTPAALPASAADPLSGHPRIVAAERAVAAAQAKARLVRIKNRDSPDIGVQVINEKQPGTRWDTRVGVMFRFPFATEARNAPLRAAAEEVVTQAQVQLDLARREVLAGTRQAGIVLAAAERSIPAAARAASELDRRRGQIERAWRLGEMPFIEVVRADGLAFDAELARDKAATELDAARLGLRLAEGALP
ncbi:TolC family protein [Rhodopila sp.]|uniref:TolC family protein n=1 Tax=Rhodopila sp. TaxID=2480087 RepID=UPI003D0F9C7C